ncbi:hypothetical protein BFS35_010965 [Macrococcoides goetzii]|uniref:Uncharacterized protein n=1 Tax=Macrococcoides goetzii TaxID=1891097 RepID=A0A2G5NWP4_9STAP|nr:hypothetical protein [Macrococcus goetzii]RAI79292.1 hypothetical protein BFS35_012085 [Macrococcus goetzii]RAI79659.1 hypothetical protein BFS35_010965 [Macrococcus goetzii]
MIKRFIDRVDNLGTEAWIAILNYIDTSIDNLQERSKSNEDRINKVEEEFRELKEELGDAKAVIDSNKELSKTIKKTALTTGVGAVVMYILNKLGVV